METSELILTMSSGLQRAMKNAHPMPVKQIPKCYGTDIHIIPDYPVTVIPTNSKSDFTIIYIMLGAAAVIVAINYYQWIF